MENDFKKFLKSYSYSHVADINGIDNTMPSTLEYNAILIFYLLLGLQRHLRRRVKITSGYRCPELNEKVGGIPNSLHCKSLAVDVKITFPDIRTARSSISYYCRTVSRYYSIRGYEIDFYFIKGSPNYLHLELQKEI